MWDQGGQPWPQWPMNQQQWMQSFQHQQDPSGWHHLYAWSCSSGNDPRLDWCNIALILQNDSSIIALFTILQNDTPSNASLVVFLCCAGQVDWAALAQAWIAQKESTGPTVDQQNIHPNGQDIPGMDPVMPNNHGSFQGDNNFGRMWQPGKL